MSTLPKVSVIIIFLNEERFIEEAVESILAQSYGEWELLLVDDGSTDNSTIIAQQVVEEYNDRMRYLEHSGHTNRGMSASRNLGIRHAKGDYVAFLDADDVWLPHKLEQQVEILEAQPEAAMLYGNTQYWYSWTNDSDDQARDFIPELRIRTESLLDPPYLLPLYLQGKATVPCTCSLLIRRNAFDRVGGFEESFRGMYEDQAFYAKIVSNESVYVSSKCLERYRQHPESSVSLVIKSGKDQLARRRYLVWLGQYLVEQGIMDQEIWVTLRKQLWLNSHYSDSGYSAKTVRIEKTIRWIKRWLLRLDERFLPTSVSNRLWYETPEQVG